jgi:hypothetical protein
MKAGAKGASCAGYLASGARASPQALKGLLPEREAPRLLVAKTLADRQVRHMAVRQTLD